MSSKRQVSLRDIEDISLRDLKSSRLNNLQNGFSSFDTVLNSQSDPIALTGSKPYEIVDGRHRVYLARQKGYSKVPAIFV